jgi:predicted metal-dependent hydrolase
VFPDRFLLGYQQFEQGQFFNAHETWETLWRETTDPDDKTFYHGCIQLAVALHHHANGNTVGTHNLLIKACEKFQAIMGIQRFHGVIRHCQAVCQQLGYPILALMLDAKP